MKQNNGKPPSAAAKGSPAPGTGSTGQDGLVHVTPRPIAPGLDRCEHRHRRHPTRRRFYVQHPPRTTDAGRRLKLLLTGSSCLDYVAFNAIDVEPMRGEVRLRYNGWVARIPTTEKARPGAKITAQASIHLGQLHGLIQEARLGGGAFNMAAGLIQQVPPDAKLDLAFTDSSAGVLRCNGLRHLPAGLHTRPVHLLLPLDGDKLIIKSPTRILRSTPRPDAVEALRALLVDVDAVVAVSPRGRELVELAWAGANGAPRIFQPGSMAATDAVELCRSATVVVWNFEELQRLARHAGFPKVGLNERDSGAAQAALAMIHSLRGAGVLASCEAAVATMGAAGGVVCDFARQQDYGYAIETDGPVGTTRAGAGDMFLASHLLNRLAAQRIRHLKDPEGVAAALAAHSVARWHGHSRPRVSYVPL